LTINPLTPGEIIEAGFFVVTMTFTFILVSLSIVTTWKKADRKLFYSIIPPYLVLWIIWGFLAPERIDWRYKTSYVPYPLMVEFAVKQYAICLLVGGGMCLGLIALSLLRKDAPKNPTVEPLGQSDTATETCTGTGDENDASIHQFPPICPRCSRHHRESTPKSCF
jgi:hypothetical protein